MNHENLQGLTLEMKLDALGVHEGMKGLKRELGVVNSEMKATLSAFDKSEKSMKQYENRLEGLNNKLTVQKKIYDQAKQNLDQVNESYKKATAEIKNVENQLYKLTNEHKKNEQVLKKSNDEIKKSNDVLEKARLQQRAVNSEKTRAKQKLDQLRQAEKQLRDSGKATTEQIKEASNATKQQRQVHKNLVEQYKKERTSVKQLSDRHKELKGQNVKVKQSYKQSNTELKNAQKQHKNLNKEIQDYIKNQAEATKKINNEKAALNNLERAIQSTTNEMKLFNKEQAIANSHFTKTADKYDKLGGTFNKIGQGAQSLGRNMSMLLTTPIVGGLGLALKTGADFEQQMSRVGAIAEASGKQLHSMTEQAKSLGASTSKSASQVAKGMEELAALGFNANQVMKAMPGVISAAEASGADMAETATVMASSINAFGIEASDATHVADVLAMAANKSAADITDMGTSFQYAGAPAHALGASLEETAAAIGVMRDSGIEASTAGTALRASFIRLANPTKKTKKAMEEMGIHLTDNEGKFVGISNLVGQFQKQMEGMTKEQKLANVATITGTEAASGFLAMIDAGPDKIEKMTKSLENSDGASKKAADKMMDNLKGALEEMSGAFETLGIQIGQDLTPYVSKGAKQLQRLADGFSSLPGWQRKTALGFGLLAAATGPLILGTGLLLRGIGSAMKGYAGLNRLMAANSVEAGINAAAQSAAGSAMIKTNSKGAKASKGIGKLSGVFGLGTKSLKVFTNILFKGVKGFGPWGLALTAITTGLGIAYNKVDWFREGVNGAFETIKVFGKGIGGKFLTGIKDLSNWVGKLGDSYKKMFKKSEVGQARIAEYKKLRGVTKGLFDELAKGNKKATDTANVLGEGVSKGTKKALEKYVKFSEESIKAIEKIKIDGGKLTEEAQKNLNETIKNGSEEAVKAVQKRNKEIEDNLKKTLEYSESLSEEEKQNLIQKTEEVGQEKVKKIEELNLTIYALQKKEYTDGKLTPEEANLLKSKLEERNKLTVEYAAKGEEERQAIITRMEYNAGGLSAQEISEALKKAYDIEKKEIKKATEERDKELKDLNESSNDTNMNENERRSIALDIESRYNDAVDKAKKKSKEVRDTIKKANKDIEKEMNLSNGHVYTGAEKLHKDVLESDQKYWKGVEKSVEEHQKNLEKNDKKYWEDIEKNAEEYWKEVSLLYKSEVQGLKVAGKLMWEPIKTGWNSTKKWVTKKTATASGWLVGVKVKAGNLWADVKTKTSKTFSSLSGKTKEKFKGMYKTSAKFLGKTAGTAFSKFQSVSSNSKKWLGKAAGTASSKFGSILSSAKNNFNKTKDKVFTSTKDVSNSARKWFGKTARSAYSNFGDMWGSAKSNFSKVASHGWKKAKSVYDGFKKWLNRTLSFIKNIGEDMGRAAADLGIKVANKAIAGLNKMISGINKIASAITGDNLLKPIPDIGGKKLSTGTTANSISTDSEGGLLHPTFAIVNDKGPGNGTGGYTQEIIERKDGSMYMPKGQDVPVFLEPGDKVHNGSITQQLDKLGLLPRFHSGSSGQKRLDEKLIGSVARITGKYAAKASNAAHGISKKAEDAFEKTEEVIKVGASNLGKGFGEVLNWIEKPKELVHKMMRHMGVNFDSIPAFTGTLIRGAYKKLTSGLIKKVKEMFEDFGGGTGDASWLLKHNIWQKFGSYTGGLTFNGGKHYGMDFGMAPGTPVYAVKGGRVRLFEDYGGGHSLQIQTAPNEWNWYMHLSEQLAKNGQIVATGEKIALSGNSGHYTSGSGHLHFQLMRGSHPGNDTAIDPEKWLRSLKDNNSGASYARKIIKQAQNILGGRYKSPAITENMMKLAKRESNYNPNAVNNWDSNAHRGTPSKGMFQMIEPTFRANAKPGYTNFNDPLHQAISDLRYIVRTYGWGGFPRAAAYAYANGGISSTHKIAEISENNRAEAIVPLTKRTRAIQLTEQIMRYLGMEKAEPSINLNNDNSVMEKLLKQIVFLNQENNKLIQMIFKVLNVPKENYNLSDIERELSRLAGNRSNQESYMQGGI